MLEWDYKMSVERQVFQQSLKHYPFLLQKQVIADDNNKEMIPKEIDYGNRARQRQQPISKWIHRCQHSRYEILIYRRILKAGNSTFIIGLEDERVQDALELDQENRSV